MSRRAIHTSSWIQMKMDGQILMKPTATTATMPEPRLLKAAYNYQTWLKIRAPMPTVASTFIQLMYDAVADLNTKLAEPIDASTLRRMSDRLPVPKKPSPSGYRRCGAWQLRQMSFFRRSTHVLERSNGHFPRAVEWLAMYDLS